METYRPGHILKVRDYGYFRVVKVESGELIAKMCFSTSPYDFVDDQLYTIDPEDFKGDIEVVTWYAAGFFDSMPKSVWEGSRI